MYVDKGSPQDAREIARLYSTAFPESVELFFGKKSTDKLLNLLELAFSLVFHWGGEALLVMDEAGVIRGYCMYRRDRHHSSKRNWGKVLQLLGQMAGKVTLPEIAVLLHNQLIMTCTKRTKKAPTPRTQARIVSIAVSPECQGQGVGTLLLYSALENLAHQRIGLNVRADNRAARHLYAKAGFQEYGTTRDLSGRWIVLVKEPYAEANKW
ncbi:MAG TPA: hypothetical protein DDZ66_01655 [Firmicutes bacterium]|nr:hypothetical protein [Bacillota bacterium]